MDGSALPWERDGDAGGVGVCLSGGGLRAASFAMGAMQALQQDRGLLFGETSADLLAVVSGGSYIGATEMLNAARADAAADGQSPPLADDSAEARHVTTNGTYLKRFGTAATMAISGLANVTTFVAIFAWSAVMFTCVVTAAEWLGIGHPSSLPLQLGAAIAFVLGGRILLRGVYLDGGAGRVLLPLGGAAVVLVTAASALAAIRQAAPLSDTTWWTREPRWLFALAACAVVVVVSMALARFWRTSAAASAATWLAARIPALTGGVLFCLIATAVADTMERAIAPEAAFGDTLDGFVLLFGALVAAAVMAQVGRTSLHGMYRDGLARGFSVVRNGGDVTHIPPTAQKLSDLAPPAAGPDRFPRLLVCATANVLWDPANPQRSPLLLPLPRRRRSFALFVYSHDRCGLAGIPGASFQTRDLEHLQTRAGIRGTYEPTVSLMSAAASTGAAVSPAMGRRTSELFRPVLAIMNLRLGRWLPNPLSARIRADVAQPDGDERIRRRSGIGGAYDEFVPELFGLHRADAPTVYISDGGHYDNLGLIALLRAGCSEIWCVDAEADPHGRARQLRTTLALARQELGVEVAIDLDALPGPEAGVLAQGHVSGTISYRGGATGRLTVVKLGLTPSSDAALRHRQTTDRGFPAHNTFWPPWRVMWYDRERFDAYRQVGFANALAASRAETSASTAGVIVS